MKHFLLLLAILLANQVTAIAVDYPHVTAEPQKSGWPLTADERAYIVDKPEHDRRPGREINKHLPQLWPVVPTAGHFGGEAWLKLHEELVKSVQQSQGLIDVLLVGDSITIQWSAAWKKHFPKFKAVNIGIGGDKTQNVLWRLDHGGVEGLEPKTILLMIGNNNMFFTPETGIEAAAKGIEMCVKNLQEKFPKAGIIVAKILPAHAPGNRFYEDIKKTNAALDLLKLDSDPNVQVLDMWADFTNADGTLKPGLFTPDNIHLTQDGGYALYAEKLRPLLAKLLVAKPARPMLLANYYCWYHDGAHPKRPFLHWTYPASENNALAKKAQQAGEPPPNSVYRPLVGYYDSADSKIAEWHVLLAKAAGIDAFLVDWWDTHNQLDQNVDRGILAAAKKHDFKFALLDERAQFHQTLEEYQAMLTRSLKRYKDHPCYLRIDGRPVVYLYQVAAKPGLSAAEFPLLKKHVESEVGPVYWIVDKISHDAKAANAGDLGREKRIPADWLAIPGVDAFGFYSTFSNFRAHEYDALVGKYRYMTKLAHDAGKKMLLPVHPGHDNSHFVDKPYVMPRRDGDTFQDYLRAATDAGADFIMVTSWNEWPESTVIEPSSSWPDPYLYLKILANWKGEKFTLLPVPSQKMQ